MANLHLRAAGIDERLIPRSGRTSTRQPVSLPAAVEGGESWAARAQ